MNLLFEIAVLEKYLEHCHTFIKDHSFSTFAIFRKTNISYPLIRTRR